MSAPTTGASSDVVQDFEAQLEKTCRERLSLGDGSVIEQQAKQLCQVCLGDLTKQTNMGSIKGSAGAPDNQTNSVKLWQACFLYIAKKVKLGTEPEAGVDLPLLDRHIERSFTLTQLLEICSCTYVDFAREMRHVLNRAKPKILQLLPSDLVAQGAPGAGADDSAEIGAIGGASSGEGASSAPGRQVTLEGLIELDQQSMDFCHMSALFIKYKTKFEVLFTPFVQAGALPPSPSRAAKKQKGEGGAEAAGEGNADGGAWEEDAWFRLGWLLFILCKAQLLPGKFSCLLDCASLLVCVLNFLLAHMPIHRLRHSLNDPQAFPVRTATNATYTLGCVSFMLKAQLGDVQKLMPKVDHYLSRVLTRDPVVARTEMNVDAVIMTGCGDYKGLLAVGSERRQLENVERCYEDSYRMGKELDERLYATQWRGGQAGSPTGGAGARSPGPSPRRGAGQGGGMMTPRLNKSAPLQGPTATPAASWPSPFRAPLPPPSPLAPRSPSSQVTWTSPAGSRRASTGAVPATPISEAMATTQWLRRTIEDVKPDGSGLPALERFLSQCRTENGGEVKPQVDRYVNQLADKVLPSAAGGESASLDARTEAVRRRNEGLALYYKVLEAMLVAEEAKAGNDGAEGGGTLSARTRGLVLNKNLHCMLVAFAFEILAECYQMTVLMFPAVLTRLNICAFDLCRVVEPLVRSHVNLNLPRELKRHLYAIEESCLESLSWKAGSTFYDYMVEARATGEGQGGAFTQVNALPNSFGALGGRPGGNYAERYLVEFFAKVAKLCTFRAIDLCSRLDRDEKLRLKSGEKCDAALVLDQVVKVVKHVIYEQTRLLYNRHVDQVVLCSLYGVCKVHGMAVTFRDIVHYYSRQPQCKQEVYRSVVLKQSYPGLKVEECGDIILFYNKVFVSVVQNELLNLAGASSVVSPNRPPTSELLASPPRNNKPPPVRTGGEGAASPASPTATPAVEEGTGSPRTISSVKGNVYASKLPEHRKQEYLLASPSSHSLFAFVGEATHAYQSPSRRLDMINSKLNQKRQQASPGEQGRAAAAPPAGPGPEGGKPAGKPKAARPLLETQLSRIDTHAQARVKKPKISST